MWDLSGSEKFKNLCNMYIRDSDAIILVFDITNRSTFDEIKNFWIKEVQEKAPENVAVVLLGNKIDKQKNEEVPFQEAREFALF